MCTTDSIPGEHRAVTRCEVAWVDSAPNMKSARESLGELASENHYDAVVGVRFLAVPDVHGKDVIVGSGSIRTKVSWAAYGTCVAY